MSKVVVVIGAGVAGISSLYFLSENMPEDFSKIHCFDDGNPNAPSRDEKKITRVDYADIKTMKQAMVFHKKWQTLPDFKEFIEKRSRLVAYGSHETYRQIASNRKELGLEERPVLSRKDVWEKYKLLLPEDTMIVLEEDDYLINLSECIKSLREKCEMRGVKFINEHVDRLHYLNGSFGGVVLAGDRKMDYMGARVVLAAGPWSESLLLRSGKQVPLNRMAKCVESFVFIIEVDVRRTDPIVSVLGLGEYRLLFP
jgi:glycine/D-amino acid oxidase-like deaminating enzyme